MPTWGEILSEINRPENAHPNGNPDYDKVRRKYLRRLFDLTERPTIVYSAGFLDRDYPSDSLVIELGDVQGFMNAVAGISDDKLDLIITSPGGSPEATESIVAYLRTRFDDIRAIVPVAAMSAATMLALACDKIVMGTHSQLGPIDPQFTIFTPEGPRSAPGQAILDQFEKAKDECGSDHKRVVAWMPILRSYLPGLIAMCEDQRKVAVRMVQEWLQKYMLRNDPEAEVKAEAAALWFSDYQYFGSHARRVSINDVAALGLTVSRLEEEQKFQDAVLSVHHCLSLTHSNMGAAKIIENHLGKAYVKLVQNVVVAPPRPTAQPQPAAPSSPMNRAARRRQPRNR